MKKMFCYELMMQKCKVDRGVLCYSWWQNLPQKHHDNRGNKDTSEYTISLFSYTGSPLILSAFLVRLSILSSSGWRVPTTTREWRGGPRSQWWISCSESWAILWVTAPTLATPTQVVAAVRTKIAKREKWCHGLFCLRRCVLRASCLTLEIKLMNLDVMRRK